MQDTTRTITKSALRFLSGTFLSRLTGMARDVAMAYAFGTHPSVAAFLTAFRLSHLFRRLLGEGAMQTAFIPQFEHLRAADPSRATRLFLDLKKWITLIILGFIILTTAIIWPLFAHHEIIKLTLLMLPSLLFICLYGINASFLQCHNHYFTASVAPCLFNLIWIASLLFLYKLPAEKAMEFLALSIILACLAQWLATRRETAQLLAPPSHETHDLKTLIAPLSLSFIGVASTQVNAAVDTLFARFAEAEGPAYLWYAIRLQQLPLALFGIALSSALLPPLTRAIKSQNIEQFCHFLRFAIRQCLNLMLPITLYLFLLGDHCVHLLFQHGSFTPASTAATSNCLYAYAFGLIPMALILLLAPALYAFNDYRAPSKGSVISMTLNILLNALFIFAMGYGAFSVAIATSLSAWWQCYYLYRCLQKHVPFAFPPITQTLTYTLAGAALYKLASHLIPHTLPLHPNWQSVSSFCLLSLTFGLIPLYGIIKERPGLQSE